GYLFLGLPEQMALRREAMEMQRAQGAEVVMMTRAETAARFPWLHTDDLGSATFGVRNEGWFDAWQWLSLVRRAARERGAAYVTAEADTVVMRNGRVSGVRTTDGQTLPADWCVIAAGPGSGALMRRTG